MSIANQTHGRSRSSPETKRLFDVLANRRRQHLLTYIAGTSGRCDVDDLARKVAVIETTESPDRSSEPVERVRTSLLHSHLPKLDDEGVVAYDEVDGTVAETVDTGNAMHVLRTARHLRSP